MTPQSWLPLDFADLAAPPGFPTDRQIEALAVLLHECVPSHVLARFGSHEALARVGARVWELYRERERRDWL